MLETLIKNYVEIDRQISEIATSGYIFALNVENVTPQYLHTTYPSRWVQQYNRRRYTLIDPTVHWGLRNEGCIRWGDINSSKMLTWNNRVFKRASEHGLKYGASGNRNLLFSKSMKSFFGAARPDRDFTGDELETLFQIFVTVSSAVAPKQQLDTAVSETMRLVAEGHSIAETAIVLNITQAAVKKRLEKSRQILGAKTTTHAVALALANGQIRMPS